MSKFLSELIACIFISGFISLIFSWIGHGNTNNNRIFYFGLFAFLLALTIIIFDSNRKIYTADDFSAQDVFIKSCSLNYDNENEDLIIADENYTYELNRLLASEIRF